MGLSIYNQEEGYQCALRHFKRTKMSENNREKILEFDRYLKINQKLSLARRIKYLRILSNCANFLGMDFEQATKRDIENLVEKIDDSPKWKSETKRDYRVFIKRFYKYLLTEDDLEYPKIVNWIKTMGDSKPSVERSELLTEEDLKKLLSVAESIRDKAFIHVLAESGCRIGEIGTLQRKHIMFDQYGCIIKVDGKTGERPIRLVRSVNDLNFWVKHHPSKKLEAPLWPSPEDPTDCLGYASFAKILRKHFRKAELKGKKNNLHSIRHFRMTQLSPHLSDQELKIFAGWSPNSRMIGVYSHLNGGDVADKILKLNNIEKKEKKLPEEERQECPRCKSINSQEAQFCFNCNLVLDETIAQRIDKEKEEDRKIGEMMNKNFKSDPELKKLINLITKRLNELS